MLVEKRELDRGSTVTCCFPSPPLLLDLFVLFCSGDTCIGGPDDIVPNSGMPANTCNPISSPVGAVRNGVVGFFVSRVDFGTRYDMFFVCVCSVAVRSVNTFAWTATMSSVPTICVKRITMSAIGQCRQTVTAIDVWIRQTPCTQTTVYLIAGSATPVRLSVHQAQTLSAPPTCAPKDQVSTIVGGKATNAADARSALFPRMIAPVRHERRLVPHATSYALPATDALDQSTSVVAMAKAATTSAGGRANRFAFVC